ncbi:MAG: hypothetical protein NTV48_00580 [Candidatus Vogelbacteria bacterium]|nr:hypothetical protein [Candidatus Vogelbacteria bacterium]
MESFGGDQKPRKDVAEEMAYAEESARKTVVGPEEDIPRQVQQAGEGKEAELRGQYHASLEYITDTVRDLIKSGENSKTMVLLPTADKELYKTVLEDLAREGDADDKFPGLIKQKFPGLTYKIVSGATADRPMFEIEFKPVAGK